MSSTGNCSSSPRVSIARASGNQERPDPEILLPSEDESIPEEPDIPEPGLPPDSAKKVNEDRKPALAKSWERILKEVSRHDEDMVKGWRDDIDTLLVFAGLFSAVVTAFTIESYQWLNEDPADTTVLLLTQLISMQVNGSQSISFEPTQFKPDASSIRINVFWFLSLIFSLTSALFGLLCKQWVREHQRDTTTRTPGEALALRQLRRDSFEKWGVSSFLSALPILLEVALLLFFVGVLDLLWNRHPIPFAICFVAVSLSAGLYLLTTLLPTLTVPRDQRSDIKNKRFNELSYQFICPYKSPQAWVVYQLSCTLIGLLLKFPTINNFLERKARGLWDHIESPASDWSSFDLWVVRQFDQLVSVPYPADHFSLKVYELRAFEWAVAMFRDSPSVIPHLQNVLGRIPPSVAVSAVIGRWDLAIWKAVSIKDVENALSYPGPFPLRPTIRYPILQQPGVINSLFHHQCWETIIAFPLLQLFPDKLFDSMKHIHLDMQRSTGLRFVIPFPVIDALWTHQDRVIRTQSLKLLSLLENSWKVSPGYDEGRVNDERRAFMGALARHINRKDRVSILLTSKRGYAFIRFIHNEGITRRLSSTWSHTWRQAIQRTQEIGGLPSDYFAPIPENMWGDLPTLPNLDPVRYSVETERDLEVDNDEFKLDIVTSIGSRQPSAELGVRNPGINASLALGNCVIGLSNSLRNHESGAGQPKNQEDFIGDDNVDCMDKDNVRSLGSGIARRIWADMSPDKRADTGMLDSSKQGDIGGSSYNLYR
ncbi:hypothetical protein WG66_003755 [Moniliophthora roreri]|uniref:DUF6535 domain-containing protein n=1 Tax=Moniliophthora roreri TaxID=221103 RepID=A0A0W0GCE8_MONRR|nr:hypothetical protein WG66_003755 [Moniliophthora roreri]